MKEGVLALDDELDRAGIDVADGARGSRGLAQARARGQGPGAGASSTTFWWRRWTEQSRSCRDGRTLPWLSAKTWTSMWRGFCR
jgi:hypothetical protein